jgi:ribosomal-protein-alanine N-acetyltransferase
MPATLLTTPRLALRPVAPGDCDALHALFTMPGVRRYLLDDTIVQRKWVEEVVRASEAKFVGSGAGLWAVEARAEPGLIGVAGFHDVFEPPEEQLIFAVADAAWGRGLGTEAALAVVAHVFDVLGRTRVLAATDPPNLASQRVLARLGMEPLGPRERDGRPALYFVLEADRFRRVGAVAGPAAG